MYENYVDHYSEALKLALMYHRDQKDKSGEPYIGHPIRVSKYIETRYGHTAYLERTVALLHDIVEDTECTLEILSMFFPENVVNAVDAITRRTGEKPEAYLRRVAQNFIASRVKLCDIKDNTDPVRLDMLSIRDQIHLRRKYRKSLSTLIHVSQNHLFRELAKEQLEEIPE